MIPADLHFNFWGGLYAGILALLVPCIGWLLYRFRQKMVEQFASKQVLEDILVPRSRFNYWAKVTALSLTLSLATIAWMEPQGNGHYPPGVQAPQKKEAETVRRRVHDVIFLIDASASMAVKDTRTGAARLDYAKEIVDEVISRLRGENVALWAFTGEPIMLSPLTMDYLYVRLRLKQMEINEGNRVGTNFVEALSKLRRDYFSTLSSRHRTLVILSDGGDTRLEGLSGEKRNEEISAITNLVGEADALNLHVHTVGMGTKDGGIVPGVAYEGKSVSSRLDSKLLIDLAKRGRGDHYTANDMNALQIAQRLLSRIEKESGFETVKRHHAGLLGKEDLIYDLYFQIPLSIAILLLLFVIYFPDTRKKRVP